MAQNSSRRANKDRRLFSNVDIASEFERFAIVVSCLETTLETIGRTKAPYRIQFGTYRGAWSSIDDRVSTKLDRFTCG